MLYYILYDMLTNNMPTNDMLYDMLCSVAYEERKDVFSQLCAQQLQTLTLARNADSAMLLAYHKEFEGCVFSSGTYLTLDTKLSQSLSESPGRRRRRMHR